ncbi:hypothetical protein CMQ_4217 [Grosmannia clavigera kw1407]|uniref:Uncharacterized protein n=1 Tax=Grosmannia clavigera (strain kw1407 / UAMH 11150) TaxID=655863 RepID=F0X889_GROCL|nr:uncharacterized protein CMQ_4217 [Grosmannia clavigera kw1407]EFX06148.1 hypothetical protein CMQ_4217 [Grosmannia clavigera kw1407]
MPFATPIMRSSSYKSLYGPKYHSQPNYKGITSKQVVRFGIQTGPFAVAAAVAALFYTSGIPRIQTDILQKIPVVGSYFTKEVNPADSPF